jgi:hypothetical protein
MYLVSILNLQQREELQGKELTDNHRQLQQFVRDVCFTANVHLKLSTCKNT